VERTQGTATVAGQQQRQDSQESTAADSKPGQSDTNYRKIQKNLIKKVLKSFKNDLLSKFNTFYIIWCRLQPSHILWQSARFPLHRF
jgi:hypothetical protein